MRRYYYEVEKTAKTDNDALAAMETELKHGEEIVCIETLEELSKGLFSGLIGGKKLLKQKFVIVKSQAECARLFLNEILSKLGLNLEVVIEETEEEIYIDLRGEDVGAIIGKKGKTIDAIQLLTRLVASKSRQFRKGIVVDVEDYKKKREGALVRLARSAADKVVKTGKIVEMEPMNGEKRRIIHSVLQEHPRVMTYSIGEDSYNNRRVVVKLRTQGD